MTCKYSSVLLQLIVVTLPGLSGGSNHPMPSPNSRTNHSLALSTYVKLLEQATRCPYHGQCQLPYEATFDPQCDYCSTMAIVCTSQETN